MICYQIVTSFQTICTGSKRFKSASIEEFFKIKIKNKTHKTLKVLQTKATFASQDDMNL